MRHPGPARLRRRSAHLTGPRLGRAAGVLASLALAITTVPTVDAQASPHAGDRPRQVRWQDYRYTLTASTYFGPGNPIRITVKRGEVVDARYLHDSHGHEPGDRAFGRDARSTVQDLVRRARSDRVAWSRIWWQDDRPTPRRIFIDYDADIIDEETMYYITQVRRLHRRR